MHHTQGSKVFCYTERLLKFHSLLKEFQIAYIFEFKRSKDIL